MKGWITSLALSLAAASVKRLGLPTLRQLAVAIGKAFGPDGCQHFSELPLSAQLELQRTAPILKTLHTDWPAPLRWVPRSLTCYVTPANVPPAIIYGNGTVEDIPARGTFVVTRGYIALTSLAGWHFRAGFRWDRNDLYLEFPSFTVKQLSE